MGRTSERCKAAKNLRKQSLKEKWILDEFVDKTRREFEREVRNYVPPYDPLTVDELRFKDCKEIPKLNGVYRMLPNPPEVVLYFDSGHGHVPRGWCLWDARLDGYLAVRPAETDRETPRHNWQQANGLRLTGTFVDSADEAIPEHAVADVAMKVVSFLLDREKRKHHLDREEYFLNWEVPRARRILFPNFVIDKVLYAVTGGRVNWSHGLAFYHRSNAVLMLDDSYLRWFHSYYGQGDVYELETCVDDSESVVLLEDDSVWDETYAFEAVSVEAGTWQCLDTDAAMSAQKRTGLGEPTHTYEVSTSEDGSSLQYSSGHEDHEPVPERHLLGDLLGVLMDDIDSDA
eukprot:TRINITY_DN6509_c0_g2_i1.p1 TRINITY_DN6509_c0_g2~~TRINITY_DN6509_c0_g2_i1.p1  ORF type:complete len:345 (+),score=35.85 TRINITY_DN6509_c0_g2_i1:69-1103(+)